MTKEELEKENAELQEKISVLLSCKKCPENKGGWICVKEYEDKCLAQKIEFIKELKKENAEMKEQLTKAMKKSALNRCHYLDNPPLKALYKKVHVYRKKNWTQAGRP